MYESVDERCKIAIPGKACLPRSDFFEAMGLLEKHGTSSRMRRLSLE